MVYVTQVPRRFVLDSGEIVTLNERDVGERLFKGTLFRLWVPGSCIDRIRDYLTRIHGFTKASPSRFKGEKYGLRRILDRVWELHVRLYGDGFIDAEVEVRRDYLQHLVTRRRVNVVYEAFEYYRGVYGRLHLWYAPARRWVKKVLEHFNVKLREPRGLIPWRPIALGTLTLEAFIYALSRLTGG